MTVVTHQSFYLEQVREVTVVSFTVSGVVGSNFERVSDDLFELVEFLRLTSDPIQVVLDMKALRQIDDWGLAMLRAFSETMSTYGGTVILCRMMPGILDTIAETGMQSTFQIRETRMEAISAFSDDQTEARRPSSRIFAAMTAAIQ